MLGAREDPGRRHVQQKTVYRIQQKTAPQGGFQRRPQRSHGRIQRRGDARVHERRETVFRTCEGKLRVKVTLGSDIERVVVKCLDRKTRAPTANRRLHSGVRRCQTSRPRIRRYKLPKSGAKRVGKNETIQQTNREQSPSPPSTKGG